jgi:hypothetical protein
MDSSIAGSLILEVLHLFVEVVLAFLNTTTDLSETESEVYVSFHVGNLFRELGEECVVGSSVAIAAVDADCQVGRGIRFPVSFRKWPALHILVILILTDLVALDVGVVTHLEGDFSEWNARDGWVAVQLGPIGRVVRIARLLTQMEVPGVEGLFLSWHVLSHECVFLQGLHSVSFCIFCRPSFCLFELSDALALSVGDGIVDQVKIP